MEDEDFLTLDFIDPSILKDFKDVEPEEKEEDKPNENLDEPKADEPKEEIKGKENLEKPEEQSSPISSSIALALRDEGVLQTLNDEGISNIKTTEDLIEAFREEINNRLDDRQKKIDQALTYGVEPTVIQQYEQYIKTLDGIDEDYLDEEDDQAENYRKNLIYQHYMTKGFSQEDAVDMVNRSIESGNDIKDAKKALTSLKKFYKDAYDNEIKEAEQQYNRHVESQKKQIKDLEDSIMNDDDFYNQFEMSKTARKKVFESVAKASVTDGNNRITPLQKFIKDDPNKANKIIGTLFVLTEGFTKFDNILNGTVKKKVRESVKNLERVLNQAQRSDGSLNFKSGVGAEPATKFLDFDFED